MYVKIIGISLLCLLLQHVARLVYMMGYHLTFYNHYPGPCQVVEGIGVGSEDFFLLPNGLAFITSGLKSHLLAPGAQSFLKQKNVKGGIYLFNFKNPKIMAEELDILATEHFDRSKFGPHGISGWTDPKTGTVTLFVSNHGYSEDRIEKFQYIPEKKALKHLQYYTSPLMIMVNDLEATGEDSFYFTNSYTTHSPILGKFFQLALMPFTNVGHFDGSNYRVVAEGLITANGIAMSADQKYVYVADTVAEEIRTYNRATDNSLYLKQIYPVYSFVDNIQVDMKSGDLYLGCHPIAHEIFAHLDDPNNRSPSQILQLHLSEGNVTSVTELFYDDGDFITGSSGANIYNNKMLLGSVLDKLLYCDVRVPL